VFPTTIASEVKFIQNLSLRGINRGCAVHIEGATIGVPFLSLYFFDAGLIISP
jgi:hypothetical protein